MTLVAPTNPEAEMALVGAMMLSPEVIAGVLQLVTSSSFSRPSLAEVFGTVVRLYQQGTPADHVTVSADLRRRNVMDAIGGEAVLVSIKSNTPAASRAAHYARIVADLAVVRAVQRLCSDSAQELSDTPPADVGEWVSKFRNDFDAIQLPSVELPADLATVQAFIERVPPTIDWAIPGLVARGAKHLIVAPEGLGKSYVQRSILVMGGQGLNPFTGSDERSPTFEPVRCLQLDAENPDFVISMALTKLVGVVRNDRRVDYDAHRSWIWPERRRLNLSKGRDRAMLERVVAHVKPDILLAGPLYKLYYRGQVAGLAAEELADVFDDLIDRFNLGIVLEHHAPKGQNGRRDIEPMDSQRWMGWPDIGLKLTPVCDNVGELDHVDVGRFRGDRYPLQWPTELRRGNVWPWDSTMKDDSWMKPMEAF